MSLPGLTEHDTFGFDGVSHERIKVMSTEHDVDGAIELAFKLVVDGTPCEAERSGGFNKEINVRDFVCISACKATKERNLNESIGFRSFTDYLLDVLDLKQGAPSVAQYTRWMDSPLDEIHIVNGSICQGNRCDRDIRAGW